MYSGLFVLVPISIVMFACILAVRLPLGRDLGIVAFITPWYALRIEFGVGLNPGLVVLSILAVKYALLRRFDVGRVRGFGVLVMFFVVSAVAAAISLNDATTQTTFAGGDLRNGAFRFFAVAFAWALVLLPFFLASTVAKELRPIEVVRAYLMGLLTLSFLGGVQFCVWYLSGLDPFPIGMFQGEGRSGLVRQENFAMLRISSLGGEPKAFGQSLAVGIVMLITLRYSIYRNLVWRIVLIVVFLGTLILTASTSAFIVLALGIGLTIGYSVLRHPLPTIAVYFGLLLAAFSLLAIYAHFVENNDLIYGAQRPSQEVRNFTFADLVRMQTIERVEVEDFDHVIMDSFLSDPMSVILGRGFGLAHLYAEEFIPWQFYYMQESIVVPKSGALLLVANAGVLGMILFVAFLVKYLPTGEERAVSSKPGIPGSSAFLQALMVFLVLSFFLRGYLFETMCLALAVAPALGIKIRDFQHNSSLQVRRSERLGTRAFKPRGLRPLRFKRRFG